VLKNETVSDKLNRFHTEMYKYKDKIEDEGRLLELRGRLMREEFTEMSEVLSDLEYAPDNQSVSDIVYLRAHLLKELCDLVYVAVGTATELDMDFDTAFNRVHQNNMLKWDNPTFREDGKLIKKPDHPDVDLEDLV